MDDYLTQSKKPILGFICAAIFTIILTGVWEGLLIVKWVTLGIASSIGLGNGFHTFTLFMIPKILQESKLCSVNGAMFYEVLMCAAGTTLLPTLWWGFGTSIGELPPYFVSLAASDTPDDKVVATFKRFIKRPKPWTTLVLASVPNPFFDLCGLVCGQSRVPFAHFFLPTMIGKTFIKAPLQWGLTLATSYYTLSLLDEELPKSHILFWVLDHIKTITTLFGLFFTLHFSWVTFRKNYLVRVSNN